MRLDSEPAQANLYSRDEKEVVMPVLSKVVKAGLMAACFAAAAGAAQAKPTGQSNCFFSNQWRGWSTPGPDIIYINVGPKKVYRIDLTPGSGTLKSPGYFLVSQVRGSNSICSALDLDLAVSDGRGYYLPLIARSLTRLTPEEVAAIPPKYRP